MNAGRSFLRWTTVALLVSVLGCLGAMAANPHLRAGSLLVALLVCLALSLKAQPNLKTFAFTAWVLTFVSAALVWPKAFGRWGGYELSKLIVPLVQVIMFGM